MKIKILALGKSKQKFIKEGLQEYLKRLTKYVQIDFKILSDVKLTKTNSIEIVKEKESTILEKHLCDKDFVIALDETGVEFSSVKIASFLENKLNTEKDIIFIIGGVYGLSNRIIKKANIVLSFSRFTFTHQIIRLLLLEQLYRSFTIIKNKKYHY